MAEIERAARFTIPVIICGCFIVLVSALRNTDPVNYLKEVVSMRSADRSLKESPDQQSTAKVGIDGKSLPSLIVILTSLGFLATSITAAFRPFLRIDRQDEIEERVILAIASVTRPRFDDRQWVEARVGRNFGNYWWNNGNSAIAVFRRLFVPQEITNWLDRRAATMWVSVNSALLLMLLIGCDLKVSGSIWSKYGCESFSFHLVAWNFGVFGAIIILSYNFCCARFEIRQMTEFCLNTRLYPREEERDLK